MERTQTQFTVTDSFLGGYQRLIREKVLPYQYRILNDEVPGAAKSHAVQNFRAAAEKNASGQVSNAFYGMVFQDSDLAKWLEAAAYGLKNGGDEALAEKCRMLIGLVEKAQQPDGYLNTYFTVKAPDKRWTNLQEGHELYCMGHMIEAAVAMAECTGDKALLQVARRMADCIDRRFVQEGIEGFPGHPEVELALQRLAELTGEARYAALAAHFLDARGTDYFIQEKAQRGWNVWGMDAEDRAYAQTQCPVRDMADATGHAVRAVYLYTAMAHQAAQTGDPALTEACHRLWESITRRRMYVTGSIGSAYEGERFTGDFHLPNDSAYAETCAAIGLIFFARQMLALAHDSRYADVMERALYNAVLPGMQLDGERFFYVNPLEAVPGLSGEIPPLKEDLPVRPRWFACACCPPNTARLLLSIDRYAWTVAADTLYADLLMGGTLTLPGEGRIEVASGLPFDGHVTFRFAPENGTIRRTLAIRLPAWSAETRITRGGKPAQYEVRQGYAFLTGDFTAADTVEVALDMRVRRVYADPRVSADSGRVAVTRGPLIYCAEGADNNGDVLGLRLLRGEVQPISLRSGVLSGMTMLALPGCRVRHGNALYDYAPPRLEPCTVRMIPYYAWGNRGLNEMRVWLPEAAE